MRLSRWFLLSIVSVAAASGCMSGQSTNPSTGVRSAPSAVEHVAPKHKQEVSFASCWDPSGSVETLALSVGLDENNNAVSVQSSGSEFSPAIEATVLGIQPKSHEPSFSVETNGKIETEPGTTDEFLSLLGIELQPQAADRKVGKIVVRVLEKKENRNLPYENCRFSNLWALK